MQDLSGGAPHAIAPEGITMMTGSGAISPDGTVFAGIGSDRLRLFQARAAMLKASPPKPYLRAPVILGLFSPELFFESRSIP